MKKQFFAVVAIVCLIGSNNCESEDLYQISTDIKLLNKLYDQSADTLSIDGHRYILDAILYCNLMPISPPESKNLTSINRLINIDSVSVPDNLDITDQYVINNDSIWLAKYHEPPIESLPYMIEKISFNGPKWGPNISVDVFVKINDSDNKKDYYIKKNGVQIYEEE